MNMPDLIEVMAKASGRPVAECKRHAQAFIEAVRFALRTDGEVAIHGFGRFDYKLSPSRRCRNIATGQEMISKPRRRVRFTPSQHVEKGPAHPHSWRRALKDGGDHAATAVGEST